MSPTECSSRAEFRILLRQDNADLRLTEKSHAIGLANQAQYDRVIQKKKDIEAVFKKIRNFSAEPALFNPYLESINSNILSQKVKLDGIVSRPFVTLTDLLKFKEIDTLFDDVSSHLKHEVAEQIEIQIKYSGYIDREREMAEKLNRLEYIKLHSNFDYASISALSHEGREKLMKAKPSTLGQAARISGVSPSDISILLVYLGR